MIAFKGNEDTWQIYAILDKEIDHVTSCLLSWTWSPFWKGVYSERKEFAPKGSKFFPFRICPFLRRVEKHFHKSCLRMYPFTIKGENLVSVLHNQLLSTSIWEFFNQCSIVPTGPIWLYSAVGSWFDCRCRDCKFESHLGHTSFVEINFYVHSSLLADSKMAVVSHWWKYKMYVHKVLVNRLEDLGRLPRKKCE